MSNLAQLEHDFAFEVSGGALALYRLPVICVLTPAPDAVEAVARKYKSAINDVRLTLVWNFPFLGFPFFRSVKVRIRPLAAPQLKLLAVRNFTVVGFAFSAMPPLGWAFIWLIFAHSPKSYAK